MRTILFVDDDPVVLTMYRNRLQREGFQIEVAQDGRDALNMLPEVKPDLVVLDLMLPEVNGVEVLKFIRGHAELKSTPVLVLSNAFMTDLAQKAMKAGANKGILKNECNPVKLACIIRDMLGGEAMPAAAGNQSKSYSGKSQAQAYLAAAAAAQADEMSLKTARAEFLRQSENEVATIRDHCLGYIKNFNSPEGRQRLNTLYQRVHFLCARAGLAGCAKLALLASAFEALLFDIVFRPANATPSVMQTIAQAVDALGRLFDGNLETSGLNLKAKVLVVDDDAVCNHAMVSALKRAHLDPVSTEDPKVALQLLEAGRFDIVLLDINMPHLNGFELCEALRRLPHYKTTPVIFITGNGDFKNRAQSVLSGGNDLITKPTSPLELVLKTTMYLLQPHRQDGNAQQRNILPNPRIMEEVLQSSAGTPPTPSDDAAGSTNQPRQPMPTAPVVADARNAIPEPVPPVSKMNEESNPTTPGTEEEIVFVESTNGAVVEAVAPVIPMSDPAGSPQFMSDLDKPVFKRTSEKSSPAAAVPNPVNSAIAPPDSAVQNARSSLPQPATQSPTACQSTSRKSQDKTMENKYSQAFDEISHEVARIIFGEENLTELNVRLARIALERYNVHEIINNLGDANNDSRGHASRLSSVSA